jgi:cell division protein ZipA
MDKLRLTLLIIGCLIVLGIYLWEIFYRPNPRKRTDILDAVDEIPDLPLSPLDEVEDYSEAVANLGSLLTQSRNQSKSINAHSESFPIPEPIISHAESDEDSSLPLDMSVKDYEKELSSNEDFDVFAAIEEDIQEQEKSSADNKAAHIDEPEHDFDAPDINQNNQDILVLYITSPAHTLFNGLSISKAADEVGMVYGHMNIFHHFGPGKLHSGQPLFSIANMYEPGSFDLGRMADLKTKGIAAFMYSPASIDPLVVFELYLNTTQRIAKLLGGDVRTSDNELLNSTSINSLREKAASLSED